MKRVQLSVIVDVADAVDVNDLESEILDFLIEEIAGDALGGECTDEELAFADASVSKLSVETK